MADRKTLKRRVDELARPVLGRIPPRTRDMVRRRVRTRKPPAFLPEPVKQKLAAVPFCTSTPDTPPAIYECMQVVADSGVRGDYYEFGLWQGYSFCVAQAAADQAGLPGMRFFGFDSFEGLPDLTGPDAESNEFHPGDYVSSYDEVVRNLSQYGVDWERTYLVKGWYDDLPESAGDALGEMGPAALVLVDCDLYESTVPVLRFIEGRLQEGTVVMFDDWNCFDASDDMGQRRALREFLADNPRWRAEPLLSFGWHGQAFTMHLDGVS